MKQYAIKVIAGAGAGAGVDAGAGAGAGASRQCRSWISVPSLQPSATKHTGWVGSTFLQTIMFFNK